MRAYTNIYSMLHDEYLNPWYIYQKPEREHTYTRMHHGNCDEPCACQSSPQTVTVTDILQS